MFLRSSADAGDAPTFAQGPRESSHPAGEISPSGIAEWRPILEKLGVPQHKMQTIEAGARLSGVPFQVELVASGVLDEAALYRALAEHLGLPFMQQVVPDSLFLLQDECLESLRLPTGLRPARAVQASGQTLYLIAPERLDISAMQGFLQRRPEVAAQMRVVRPSVLRQALMKRAQEQLARGSIHGLFEVMPHLSARLVLNAWQGIAIGAAIAVLVLGFATAPFSSLLIFHICLSALFLACVGLRVLAAFAVPAEPPSQLLTSMQTADLPVYTVLVALYKEADVVPDLLVALGKLVWPRSKLEIKLVCESDDVETLAAIRAQELRPYVQVIEVPPQGPRTKPKALSYALPITTGEFVVLFDAEDRPNSFQLIEAWQRFRNAGEDLACVQAPLWISNRHENWIASMFGFEYSALFRGLLPWLAQRRLVFPLGGTSNHFRRSVLERVGGWDPYNVTEDADLGLRLARLGYRTDTITAATIEDAPTSTGVWLRQRTRWFKGWAQTWLVHMRDIPQLYRELGPASFLVAQVLTAGMWISALAYSVFVVTAVALIAKISMGGPVANHQMALLALDTVNVVFGHGAFLALGWWTLPRYERRGFCRHMLLTPAYWLLLSAAAWRALWQLYRCPHAWEKTPHRSRRNIAGAQRRKPGPTPTTRSSSSPTAARSRPA
ncbi:glycosyltransferase [Chelativorans sp.]|uniref:glycosyltransferase n=1 Tax=Chelativorans sp. TaxID=2203393 RepID=UPI0028121C2A|nr:glycosyltransferase [Chelativorans sp.]